MADTSGWITLKKMVQEILFETGRNQDFYKRCMHHVINGVRDLNAFHFDNLKTVKVLANDIGVISMPSDYVSLVALSFASGGTKWTLTRRNDIINTTTTTDDVEGLNTDIGEGVSLETGIDTYRGYKTTGGKNDYYYTIDERNQRFLVRGLPAVTMTFFLDYISSGVDLTLGNATVIPAKIKEALKYYVLYKEAIVNDQANKNMVGIYKEEYKQEVSKLRFLDLPTADELRDMIYETYNAIRR